METFWTIVSIAVVLGAPAIGGYYVGKIQKETWVTRRWVDAEADSDHWKQEAERNRRGMGWLAETLWETYGYKDLEKTPFGKKPPSPPYIGFTREQWLQAADEATKEEHDEKNN